MAGLGELGVAGWGLDMMLAMFCACEMVWGAHLAADEGISVGKSLGAVSISWDWGIMEMVDCLLSKRSQGTVNG